MAGFARRALKTVGIGAAAGVALVAEGALEAQAYILRSRRVTLHRGGGTGEAPGADAPRAGVPGGAPRRPLRILHLSDLHLMPYNERRSRWTAALAALAPDFVVATGDFLSSPDSLPILERTLAPFAGVPGAFVYGSNDYFAPALRNPFDYLKRDSRPDSDRLAAQQPLPTDQMTALLEGFGWVNLNNARARVGAAGWTLDLVGVADPHIDRDRFPEREGLSGEESAGGAGSSSAGDDATLRIGVAHAPYLRVLDEMVRDGAGLIFAGHTHGGQLSVPGYGAIITNSDLPRQLASGTFPWIAEAAREPRAWARFVRNVRYDGSLEVAAGVAAVTVSAGLGTSPFVPIRINRRPEAILLAVTVEP